MRIAKDGKEFDIDDIEVDILPGDVEVIQYEKYTEQDENNGNDDDSDDGYSEEDAVRDQWGIEDDEDVINY